MSTKGPLREVILCKGIADDNDTRNVYIDTFQSAGFTCKHLPVSRFKFFNLERLRDCLIRPEDFGGLIVTSRRSVEAIELALKPDNSLLSIWNDLPTYCVGPATTSLAEKILSLKNCLGSDCGNSTSLSNFIVDKNTSRDTKPLLYPCSAIARDTIQRVLTEHDISIEKLIVYDTLPSETLENDLTRIFIETGQIFVFFSPSAVQFILKAAKQLNLLMHIRAVAIGPATADAIVKAGMFLYAVSSKPEPNALLEAIQSAELED